MMSKIQIHQIHPTVSYGDAIGNDIVEIQSVLRKLGYNSNIYAQYIHPKMHGVKNYVEYKKNSPSKNILIMHYSIGYGADLLAFVKSLPDKKILIYHNITPPEYYRNINSEYEYHIKIGREEIRDFRNIVELALGDSEFNRQELVKLGFKNTGVLPIIIELNKYGVHGDQKIIRKYNDNIVNILFVGRVGPNKKIEDIIKCFYYYNKYLNSKSRLFLVGSYDGMDKYYDKLKLLANKLNLKKVYFTGHVSFEELISYYKLADVFITMSEHEGFCVPLLESMYFKIPIIAYNSTAIPYTLGDSGILVNKKDYEEIAEMINLLVEETELRNKIIKKQNERLKEFDKMKMEKKFKKYLEDVLMTKPITAPKKSQKSNYNYEKIWDHLAKTDVLNAIAKGDKGDVDLNEFDQSGKRHAEMLSQFIDNDSMVLDVGCGIGRIEKFLGPLCGELHAVDVSSEMLKKAQKRLSGQSNIFLQKLNGTDLRCYHDNKFDFVFSMLVLQHMEKEDAYVYLKEIYRVLKKGGKVFLQFPNLLSIYYFDKSFVEYAKHGYRSITRVRPYTLPEVRKILESIDFEIESITDDGTFLNTNEICVIAFKR